MVHFGTETYSLFLPSLVFKDDYVAFKNKQKRNFTKYTEAISHLAN